MTTIAVSPGIAPLFAQPPWQSGRYYSPGRGASLSTSVILGNGSMRAYPAYVPNAVTLSRIGSEITGAGDAGSKLRLGIYTDDGTGRPGSLVIDAGTIAGDSVAVQEITISQALGSGVFWFVAVVQIVTVTQPTVRTTQPPSGWGDVGVAAPGAGQEDRMFAFAAGVTGALPASYTPTANTGGGAAAIFVKVA